MRYILMFFLIGCCCEISAQKLIIGNNQSFKQTQGRPYEITDSVFRDSSRLEVVYRHERIIDTENNVRRWSLLRMLVGDKYAQQTDLHIYFGNYRFSSMLRRTNMIPISTIDLYGDNNPPYWANMLHDRQSENIKVMCCNFNAASAPLMYEESLPQQTWTLCDETDEICGYKCLTAETSFRGRVWRVWYTTLLPVNLGPWKLSGLPGMILKAEDLAGIYSFECVGVDSSRKAIYEHIPASKIVLLRKNYLRYEKRFHADPESTLAEGEKIYVLQLDEQGAISKVDGVWTIPYNPIEQE